MEVWQLSFDIMKLAGKSVSVFLNHIIFGAQELFISCFEPFVTDERFGFAFNGYKFYMENKEVERLEVGKNLIKIFGNLQTMEIKIQ